MNKQMAIEILHQFEAGAETVALNADNSAWRSGSNWGSDWSDVDFDGFAEILDDAGLGNLIG